MGELKVGDRLPPERELTEQMGVSRTGDEALSARLALEIVAQGISVIETCYDWSKKTIPFERKRLRPHGLRRFWRSFPPHRAEIS